MSSSGGSPSPSPKSNPSPSSPIDAHKLFKPPSPSSNPNPNPNPKSTNPFLPTPTYQPSPSPAAPPLLSHGAFSYPPPTPPFQNRPIIQYPQDPLSIPSARPLVAHHAAPNPQTSPNSGSRLMAYLGTATPVNIETSISMPSSKSPSELTTPAGNPPVLHPSPDILQNVQTRLPSGKFPRGRRLTGGPRVVYDVDSRLPGELQPPQLEVTPITKYTSDPGLVLGRQIAVNRMYICYGLKLGAIRVLNINTALRSLLRGHTQKVTDMSFFAEDVPLLASASVDGRIFVWKINEGTYEDNKPQIEGKIVLALQIEGDGEPYHPRVCWHPHKQEVLVVGIGNILLKVDTIKVGKIGQFSADEPVRCPIDKPIDGVQLIGKHDGEITDLSMSQWMTTRLVSASKDGKIKFWEDRKVMPIFTLIPHDGQPVNSASFMTSPERPDHIVLITAGPLNRELKVWVPASEEGWLLPSDCESWKCRQTVDLRSSTEPKLEEAFFNQLLVLPRVGLILLANAKKNAIYALHVDYGQNPASTHMNYIADFTVTMPILSLTGTSECFSDTEQIVQLYCVQTQAIQQYALDLSQCLPTKVDSVAPEKDFSGTAFDSCISEGFSVPQSFPGASTYDAAVVDSSLKPLPLNYSKDRTHGETSNPSDVTLAQELVTSNIEPVISAPQLLSNSTGTALVTFSTISLNLDMSEKIQGFINPAGAFVQGDIVDNHSAETCKTRTDVTDVSNQHVLFKPDGNSPHLITPSEILSHITVPTEIQFTDQISGSKDLEAQKTAEKNVLEHVDVDKLIIESSSSLLYNSDTQPYVAQEEKGNVPHTTETVNFVTKDVFKTEDHDDQETHALENSVFGTSELPSGEGKEVHDTLKAVPLKDSCAGIGSDSPSDMNIMKPEVNQSPLGGSRSPVSSPFTLHSSNESDTTLGTIDVLSQLQNMREMLNQLAIYQREMQKQMEFFPVSLAKEKESLQVALGQSLEKAIRSSIDLFVAQVEAQSAKQEIIEKEKENEKMLELTSTITNCMNRDFPAVLETTLKNENSSVGQALAYAITPSIEKCISSAIADSFQKGFSDIAINQLEKIVSSKLEATLSRQIQSQFQSSGKQSLQETLKSTLESSVIPAFEKCCGGLFERIDEAFQKGLTDHAAVAQKQYESMHTKLTLTLREAVNSATSITENLAHELATGQQKLLDLVSNAAPVVLQQSNGSLGGHPDTALSVKHLEAPIDPKEELTRLISEGKFEEAFTSALQRTDVSIVSWLCSQVDLHGLCYMSPLPLSQGVLLALLQQLSCDIGKETSLKLGWMTDVAAAICPTDTMIASHVRPIFEQVYNRLLHQRTLQTTTAAEASGIRLIIHVINSVLMSCK